MIIQKRENVADMLLEVVDVLCEIVGIMEKADVLTADILDTYLECSDLKIERARYIAQYDLRIASVKAEMLSACTSLVLDKLKGVCKLSNAAFEIAQG